LWAWIIRTTTARDDARIKNSGFNEQMCGVSGAGNNNRWIKGGRFAVRTVLYMATLSATQYNPVIKVFYKQLVWHKVSIKK